VQNAAAVEKFAKKMDDAKRESTKKLRALLGDAESPAAVRGDNLSKEDRRSLEKQVAQISKGYLDTVLKQVQPTGSALDGWALVDNGFGVVLGAALVVYLFADFPVQEAFLYLGVAVGAIVLVGIFMKTILKCALGGSCGQ
jgi:hypothetical protein